MSRVFLSSHESFVSEGATVGGLITVVPEMGWNGGTMGEDTANPETMRVAAEWMRMVDERILELIREHGNLTPAAVEDKGGPSTKYASSRMNLLAEAGLLVKIHRGLFGITDDGRAYLNEDLDARKLPVPESLRDDEDDDDESDDSDDADEGPPNDDTEPGDIDESGSDGGP